jgi:hypothetical protein
MQLKPTVWTHHHTHRLFHLSMGLCLTFVAGTIVTGLVSVWLSAGAVNQDVTGGPVVIEAVVPGVTPGPISGGGGPAPVPPPTPTPTPTPQPNPQPNPEPTPNPTPSPAPQPGPGGKPGTGGGSDNGQTGSPGQPGREFQVITVITDPYRIVYQGQRTLLGVTIYDPDGGRDHSQLVDYKITGPNGDLVVEASDEVHLTTSLAYNKIFFTNKAALPGEYTITTTIKRGKLVSSSTATFRIVQKQLVIIGQVQPPPTIWWEGLLLLLILLLLCAVIAYHKAARHTVEIRRIEKNIP